MHATSQTKFQIGQLIHHRLFDYRGVIVDVDATFQGTDEWYETMAQSRPPKDKPWYHVLVDKAIHRTYVAEQNLEPDTTSIPIDHPEVNEVFKEFDGKQYVLKKMV